MTDTASGPRRWAWGSVRRRVTSAGSLVLLAVALPVLGGLVFVWLSGWTLLVVRTGSMAPYLPVDAVAVVAPVDPSDLESGSVVVFEDPDRDELVVHRVQRVLDGASGRQLETRGDANPASDPTPVPARAVRGEVKTRVLGAGWVLQRVRQPEVAMALVGIPVGLWMLGELRFVRGRRRTRRDDAELARLREEVERLETELAVARTEPSGAPPAPAGPVSVPLGYALVVSPSGWIATSAAPASPAPERNGAEVTADIGPPA
jgi:signal peptidase I